MIRCFSVRTGYVSATLAIILTSHGAVSATGEPNYEVARRVINFADLDITRPPGAAALYARITAAAHQVCEPWISSFEQYLSEQTLQCRERAIEKAVTDVNAPALTSYHLTKVKPAGERK